MPPPASFIDLTSETFPFSRTVTQAEFNAGTFGDAPNEVYFKYTPATDLAIAAFVDDQTGFQPRWRVYESDALTLKRTISDNKSWFYLLTGSTTYWVRLTNALGVSTGADLPTTWQTGPIIDSVPDGSFVVNDDSGGWPGTAWQVDGTFLGFIPSIPGGEMGASLPNGVQLWHDRYGLHGVDSYIALLAADFSLIAGLNTSPSLGGTFPLISTDGDQFYVVDPSNGNVYTVSATGTVSAAIATIPDTFSAWAAAVSRDGTILYWAGGYSDFAVHRWDLVNDVALSDLYTVPGITSGYLGRTGINEHPGDILVLSDESIVTWAHDYDTDQDTLVHLSSTGALLHSYTYDSPVIIDHIAYAADDPDAILIWWFLDNPSAHRGRFGRVPLATGVIAEGESFDTDLFESGINLVAGSPQLIGPSASCTVLTIVYADSGGGGETPQPEQSQSTPRLIRRLRRGPHLTADGLWQVFQAFQLEMETGIGLKEGQGEDPTLMLRWSDDGGHTFSNEYWVSAGKMGKYGARAIWRRLGRSRDRIFEVSMSDPVKWSLIEAHITAIQGTN